ncbi:MAG: hypothetical protein HKP30_07390, partial [Myxococcales bacterium]|nr:hypothetical protein [Myxococcales bacterium]
MRTAPRRVAGRLPWLALASAFGVAALVHGLDRHGAFPALQRPAADALVRLTAQWAPPAVEAPDVSVVAIDAQSLR